jgi:N-acetylmuramoyl-L-alanine amidase
VVDKDPTYGACDDALFSMAQLYDEMGRRFDRAYYSRRAAYYYDFVAREYPTTRHRAAAIERSAALRNAASTEHPPATPPAPEVVQAKAVPDEHLAQLTEVRYWSNEDYTRVVLQLDREVKFEKEVLHGPDRIYFDLEETRADPSLIDQEYDVNGLFIRRIRVGENRPDVIRVVLDFDHVNQHTVFALYDPFRIVIDTRGVQKPPAGAAPSPDAAVARNDNPATKPEVAETKEEIQPVGPDESQAVAASPTIQGNWTLTRTLGLKVGRVVIDPGHGGKDTGTIGPSGLREKDLVLAVALKLRDLLSERLGVEVILTRQDDRFVPLEERTAIANQKGADLFISIHANASRNRKASGVETYVLDFATDEGEIEVASRENATAQRNIRELEDLLRKIALGDYSQESRDLAHTLQVKLVTAMMQNGHQQRDRGIKQAPFIVLIGSNMPSILTEIGFISNPKDEKFYKTNEARQQVAEALYSGVEAYFQSLGVAPATQQAAAASER